MNTLSRRQKIEAMLVDEPCDTFLRYSLAMELEKEGDHAASLERLADLTADAATLRTSFFMAAQATCRA